MKLAVKQIPTGTFQLTEDNEWHCTHEDIEVEPPCCSGRDSEGNPSCGCHGGYGVLCPAWDCDGVTDTEAENIIDAYLEAPDYE